MLGFPFVLSQSKFLFFLLKSLLTRERFVFLFVRLVLALERLLCLCTYARLEHRA